MAPTAPKSGLFVGLNKGHIVITKELAPRPCQKRGMNHCSTQYCSRVLFVMSLIIREVVGFAPYEKKVLELLKFGKDKRALKVGKRALKNY
ncbi:hypothetical protein MKW92_000501 [Papaver armeniacum]|nr:hypothetical protein MKW92_000501 [Papaver armeniacum]